MISGPVEQLCESESINKHDKLLLNIINRSVDGMLRLGQPVARLQQVGERHAPLARQANDIITEMKRIMDLFIVNTGERYHLGTVTD